MATARTEANAGTVPSIRRSFPKGETERVSEAQFVAKDAHLIRVLEFTYHKSDCIHVRSADLCISPTVVIWWLFPSVCRYKTDLANTGLLKLLNTLIQFAPALFISRILKFVGSNQGGKVPTPVILPVICTGLSPTVRRLLVHVMHLLRNEGVQLSLLLFVTLCAKTAVENQYFHSISQMSSEVRGTLSTAVYRKSLKLSPSSRKNNTVRLFIVQCTYYCHGLSAHSMMCNECI